MTLHSLYILQTSITLTHTHLFFLYGQRPQVELLQVILLEQLEEEVSGHFSMILQVMVILEKKTTPMHYLG